MAINLQKQALKASATAHQWKHSLAHQARPALHYRDHIAISTIEHMTAVDAFDGHNIRKGHSCNKVSPEANPDLLVVSPAIDGRLKDVNKENSGK